MKLFLLSQGARKGNDTYDSCIVCAASAEDAVYITPDATCFERVAGRSGKNYSWGRSWGYTVEDIKCEEIGEAHPSLREGVILASFNAG